MSTRLFSSPNRVKVTLELPRDIATQLYQDSLVRWRLLSMAEIQDINFVISPMLCYIDIELSSPTELGNSILWMEIEEVLSKYQNRG